MWFLETKVRCRLEALYDKRSNCSAADRQQFLESRAALSFQRSSDATAIIDIEGILTPKPDAFLAYIGEANTAYSEIINALLMAESDDSLAAIQLNVDSPGGTVAGLFETVEVLQQIKKPITAVVKGLAASAAYDIVAQADTIIASNRASMVGSVGVVSTFIVFDWMIDVTSTNAPEKRPDVTTDEGKAMVRKELDAVEDLFIETIATGRKTTTEDVKQNFGRGGVFLADDAKTRGMIDSIAVRTITDLSKNERIKTMNLKELKAEHPDVFADAVNEGVTMERDRVVAHLTMGESSGDMKLAASCIEDGAAMSDTITAKYLAAQMAKNTQQERVAENPDDVATKETANKSPDDLFLEALDRSDLNV